MNILFCYNEPLNTNSGGILRVTYVLIKEFRQLGYTCSYVYSEDQFNSFHFLDSEKTYSQEEFKDEISKRKINIIIDQNAGFSSKFITIFKQLNVLQTAKYISVIHSSPIMNIVIFNRQRLIEGIRVADSTKQKIKFLMMLIGYPLWKKRSNKHICEMYKTIYDKSDYIVLLSKEFIPVFGKLIKKTTLDKCVAIPNPLSFDIIENQDIIKNKQKEVLIVSRLYNQEKRIDLALKIWKTIEKSNKKDWKLIIVGSGFDEESLKTLSKKLKLNNVRFEGRQCSEKYYKTASIFMFTSKIEGWGLTLTESQQNGVVPIAFDSYQSIHDIIKDGYNGCLIPDRDIKAYAKKLLWLMDNDDERKSIAINALESCHRFTKDKIINDWIELINKN